ncbi:MAG: hypothetical protein AMJ43_05905 [Coxiella sp. DG_40]|nr:MAG: hypothetical protein AMJ43_05905 [Coxiella sp. DG_40]
MIAANIITIESVPPVSELLNPWDWSEVTRIELDDFSSVLLVDDGVSCVLVDSDCFNKDELFVDVCDELSELEVGIAVLEDSVEDAVGIELE